MNIFKRNTQKQAPVTPLNPDLAAFTEGFIAHMNEVPFLDMKTDMHRRGWWASMEAEVDATTPRGRNNAIR